MHRDAVFEVWRSGWRGSRARRRVVRARPRENFNALRPNTTDATVPCRCDVLAGLQIKAAGHRAAMAIDRR